MDILEITKQGELKRADNNLVFILSESNKKIKIPIKKINVINIYNNITLNSELLYFLNTNGIALNFFQHYTGNYFGSFHIKDIKNSSNVSFLQYKAYNENRFFFQNKFIYAIQQNMIFLLKKYQKNSIIGRDITKDIKSLNKVFIGPENPMINESELWRIFYPSIEKIITKKDFPFNKRTRRPPENHLNSLISFSNMKLYSLVLNTIYATQLDARIGFLHELQGSRHSLALDIADYLKPFYTFFFIINLINQGKIKRTHFKFRKFELNEEGLFIFSKEYGEFLNQTFYISNLKRKVSLKTIIKLECYKLIRYLFNPQSHYNPIDFNLIEES